MGTKKKTQWTKTPPTTCGTYWHWGGCQSCAPLPMFVGSNGMGKAFIMRGQLGFKSAIDCDKYGGWWKEIIDPDVPKAAQCHCDLCDS